jgi:hypothetical protein
MIMAANPSVPPPPPPTGLPAAPSTPPAQPMHTCTAHFLHIILMLVSPRCALRVLNLTVPFLPKLLRAYWNPSQPSELWGGTLLRESSVNYHLTTPLHFQLINWLPPLSYCSSLLLFPLSNRPLLSPRVALHDHGCHSFCIPPRTPSPPPGLPAAPSTSPAQPPQPTHTCIAHFARIFLMLVCPRCSLFYNSLVSCSPPNDRACARHDNLSVG